MQISGSKIHFAYDALKKITSGANKSYYSQILSLDIHSKNITEHLLYARNFWALGK